jgi:hypothetical protein
MSPNAATSAATKQENVIVKNDPPKRLGVLAAGRVGTALAAVLTQQEQARRNKRRREQAEQEPEPE